MTQQSDTGKGRRGLFIPEGRGTIKGCTDNEAQVKIIRQSKKAGKHKQEV